MIEWIVSSCILILFVVLLRRLFRRRLSLRVQYAMWLAVALRLLIPVSFFGSSFSVLNLVPERTVAQDSMEENRTDIGRMGAGGSPLEEESRKEAIGWKDAPGDIHQTGVSPVDAALENNNPQTGEAASGAAKADLSAGRTSALQKPVGVTAALLCLWLTGAAFLGLAALGVNLHFYIGLHRSGRRLPMPESVLPVYETEAIQTPCMFGLIRPAVYVTPAVAAEAETLRYVLCHENTHYRHRDNWWSLVRMVCLCVHWYNPLVWLAAYLSRQDGELACDEETIERVGERFRIAYGKTLLELSIGENSLANGFCLSTTMSGGKRQLKERLVMITSRPKQAAGALASMLLLAALLVTATFTGRREANASEVSDPAAVEGQMSKSEEAGSGGMGQKEIAEGEDVPVETSVFGYSSYTGYLDECVQWSDYGNFSGCDYDGDGLTDRVWRESIEDWAVARYRIELSGGEAIEIGKVGGGVPQVRAVDLDGDGTNEILFTLSYGFSTAPQAFGEMALFGKKGKEYELLELPGGMSDVESGEVEFDGILKKYSPQLTVHYERAGEYEMRVTSTWGPENPKLDVVVKLDEVLWSQQRYDAYIGTDCSYPVYGVELTETADGRNALKLLFGQFDKWCNDNVWVFVGLEDGKTELVGLEYLNCYTERVPIRLGEEGSYELQLGRSVLLGSGRYRTGWIDVMDIHENDTAQCIQVILPSEAAGQDPGEGLSGSEGVEDWGGEGSILVTDLNFDGYEDFCLRSWTGGKNMSYYCYLWDEKEERFDYTCMLPNVEADESEKLVVSTVTLDNGHYAVKAYRFDDANLLHLVRYAEQDMRPDALFEELELNYVEMPYALPAVDGWDAGIYGGGLQETMIQWAKQALSELYDFSGTKLESCCFTVTEFGEFVFARTKEDMEAGRTFYSRCYGAQAGFLDCIPSMNLATAQSVWYSPVRQYVIPDNRERMTAAEIVSWYLERSALAEGETTEAVEETFEGNYVVGMKSGKYYELTYDAASKTVSAIDGPYEGYPQH